MVKVTKAISQHQSQYFNGEMKMDAGILVPITFFIGTAVILWKFYEGRHKERMLMIEKGVTPAEFKSGGITPFWKSNILSNLKWGLLFTFVGIGLFIGEQIHQFVEFDEESSIFACMLIFGGLALIIFYFIASKKIKEKQVNEE